MKKKIDRLVLVDFDWLESEMNPARPPHRDRYEMAMFDTFESVLRNSIPAEKLVEKVIDETIEVAKHHTDCELDEEGTRANTLHYLSSEIDLS